MNSLVLFHDILNDFVVKKAMELLKLNNDDVVEGVKTYAIFAHELFKSTDDWTKYVLQLVLSSDNNYVTKRVNHIIIDPSLTECLSQELSLLEELSRLSAKDIKERIKYQGYLPEWKSSLVDFKVIYEERMRHIREKGVGIYSKYRMFIIRDRAITPVKTSDPVKLSDLKGYESQRKIVIDNTLALLNGKPASNVLLYGDAGTGKSSTVKAVVNEYYESGLRLIEVPKKQVGYLHECIEELHGNPLKFILFIDDLSFSQENDDFYALKAVLEGSVYAKSENIVIYATGNRRHLIKERFSDREGDDVHRNETIQELTSLSARFGITVGFFKPNKETYLRIVRELKEQYQIEISDDELEKQAERFAVSGRSPRIARQFIENLKSKEE
ncbi:MAG TPA: hypothetical protein DDZ89_15085 [Clostridiales bacterium]|nr:hypothetical protein [Clostridiales bacterium]